MRPAGILGTVTSTTRAAVLVQPTALHAELRDGSVQVLDVRWRLGEAADAGRDRFAAGHIPGSVHLGVEEVFSAEPSTPTQGRHPLPDTERLAAGLAAAGVVPGRRLVVADEPGTFAADRAWWVLRWAGQDVRVLDGGFPAWQRAGLPVERGPDRPRAVEPTPLSVGALPVVTADGAAQAGTHPEQTLIDVRAAPRYRGETEPIDPVAGHIPGAVNVPVDAFYTDDGTLPDDATLQRLLRPDEVPSPVLYCGSGVSAAREVLAFAALGVTAGLFPGSWSAWCSDPARPVARGTED